MLKTGDTIWILEDNKLLATKSEIPSEALISTYFLNSSITSNDLIRDSSEILMKMLSVSVSFKIAMELVGSPIFAQPRFCLWHEKNSIRVILYGFVGNLNDLKSGNGDPNSKHTPYVCRAVSSNLLNNNAHRDKYSPQPYVDVEVSETSYSTTTEIMENDISAKVSNRPFSWPMLETYSGT